MSDPQMNNSKSANAPVLPARRGGLGLDAAWSHGTVQMQLRTIARDQAERIKVIKLQHPMVSDRCAFGAVISVGPATSARLELSAHCWPEVRTR